MPDNEQLSHLFGAYFHQDWTLDAPSWKHVVRQYLKDEGSAAGDLAADAAFTLADSALSDQDLAAHIAKLGCYYWPGGTQAFRPWLKSLALELRIHSAANNSFKPNPLRGSA